MSKSATSSRTAEHAAHDHYHRHTEIVDEHFLHENDYGAAHRDTAPALSLIFELNDHLGQDLKVAELANFMDSLGHGVEVGELERMISGWATRTRTARSSRRTS